MAWNQFNESDTTTQEILIGTNDGIIFEAMLSNSADLLYSSSGTIIWKEVGLVLPKAFLFLFFIRKAFWPNLRCLPSDLPVFS